VSDALSIQSHKGPYSVFFDQTALANLNDGVIENVHFLIDQHVADLYADQMKNVLNSSSVLLLDAEEATKSLHRFPSYVDHFVSHGIRRDHSLFAIGGGIIQDTTCFLAATILRGVDWSFMPTTLLSQADSCIGSKSSINSGSAKNILGTFTPPSEVLISTNFLDTLDPQDVRSGIGEILKVHAIDGPSSFDQITQDYDELFTNSEVMVRYIRRALAIKTTYIEEDEFDRGSRNIFNYGHSFGHALEAATDFAIPHGIAVTMGMDMANYVADKLNFGSLNNFERMHPVLNENYNGFESLEVPLDPFLTAISKDKKNLGSSEVTLILPNMEGFLEKTRQPNDKVFSDICENYLASARNL
jgi:3-dehydroquinate synthase